MHRIFRRACFRDGPNQLLFPLNFVGCQQSVHKEKLRKSCVYVCVCASPRGRGSGEWDGTKNGTFLFSVSTFWIPPRDKTNAEDQLTPRLEDVPPFFLKFPTFYKRMVSPFPLLSCVAFVDDVLEVRGDSRPK